MFKSLKAKAFDRKIIHVDMDAFYASVEQRDDPSLKGKPVAVGGSPKGRGVVAAASYEARKFGVRSAMGAAKALRLCPKITFVKPDFKKYKEASQKIREIFREVTDHIEPLALDEAYLDVTENKLNETSATKLAVYIRSRIKGQLKLTASAGVAPNKFLAKVASDLDKPDGLVVVPPHRVDEFVEKLPIEKLWGVGPATAKRLKSRGLHTTADMRNADPEYLEKILGSSAGFLLKLSHGIDFRKVGADRGQRKSRGSERTFFEDIKDRQVVEEKLRQISEEVTLSLKDAELSAKTITVKVRYHDFKTITRSMTLAQYTDDPTVVFDSSLALLDKTQVGERPIRLLGVSLRQIRGGEPIDQLELPL